MKKSLLVILTCASAHLFGAVQSINSEEQFQSTIASGTVLVDFYASWCGPCKKLAPVLDQLSDQMQDVVFAKVDTGALGGLGKKLNIKALPTVVLFRNGKEVKRFTGMQDVNSIKSFIGK